MQQCFLYVRRSTSRDCVRNIYVDPRVHCMPTLVLLDLLEHAVHVLSIPVAISLSGRSRYHEVHEKLDLESGQLVPTSARDIARGAVR